MLDLVIWMFVLALTPLALGIAWSLTSGAVDFLRVRHAQSLEEPNQRGLSPR